MSTPFSTILFFGPPGSGKGTQAKFLSALTGHYHLSAGDIFRSITQESEFGRIQANYSEKGLLIPDQIAVKMWKEHIINLVKSSQYRPERQLLFADGMPRTKDQAHLLDDCMAIKAVINLVTDDEDCLISRLQKRAVVEGRNDDRDLNALKTRMMVYNTQTKELLQTFTQKIIISVKADQLPFEVTRDILNQISALLMYPAQKS